VTRYLGIDASSKSLAFGLIEDDTLIAYGEFFFKSSSFDMRLGESRILTEAYMPMIFSQADYIIFERAVMVVNKEVALKLAQMFGAMKSVLVTGPARLVEAPPMVWQNHIGNPTIRGNVKSAFLKLHPEWKNRSQQEKGIREHRKNKTREIVAEKFGEWIESDNITDAIGLAMFGQMELKR
jgi:Holliday junction resolvasome RuvABC endonuclease subunit